MKFQLTTHEVSTHRLGKAVLSQVNVAIRSGELVGIIGANGAGKSTLLKVMLGISAASQGAVCFNERPLLNMPSRERARAVAYLAQNEDLYWPLPVEDVVALGRIPHVRDPEQDAEIVTQAMADVDVLTLRTRNVQSLSGGERARVLLARALCVQAPVLLADEPLAALDPAHQLRIMQVLRDRAAKGQAVAVVLHDLVLATRFCTQLVLMHEGRVLAQGRPDMVCTDANLARGFGIAAQWLQEGLRSVCLPWSLAISQDVMQ